MNRTHVMISLSVILFLQAINGEDGTLFLGFFFATRLVGNACKITTAKK